MADSTTTIVLLFFIFVGLFLLLIVLYKKLNRETNGEYTLRRVIYKEGGLRDRARRAAAILQSHLGVRLWPRRNSNEDGEEMQDFQEDPRQKKQRCSTSSGGSQPGEGEVGKPQGRRVKARSESESEEESREADLFVNLNQLSRSVMWSEEDGQQATRQRESQTV